jgi:hypothetical protein
VKYLSKLTLSYIANGWKEDNILDESTIIDDTITYDETSDSTILMNAIIGVGTANEYSSIGTRISPSIPLSEINKLYRINWVATIPSGTSITVETNISLDNGVTWLGWKTVKNNQFIPDIDKTTDLTNALIQIKQTLQTNDVSLTPTLESIGIVADNSDDLNKDESWDNTTSLLAKFNNTLEAGSIANSGNKIVKFRIVRREADQDENGDTYLGEISFDNAASADIVFEDITNPNTDLIYTVIPVSENGLDGVPREIEVKSDFVGMWIVDKDTGEVLVFDKAIGNVGTVESTFNQQRTQIDTFGSYPQFYYSNDSGYEVFSLSTVILPDDGKRTGKKYKDILNKFIKDHNPKIVKLDTGRVFVADISNMRASSPMVTWDGADYMTITVDVTETQDYPSYMKGE